MENRIPATDALAVFVPDASKPLKRKVFGTTDAFACFTPRIWVVR